MCADILAGSLACLPARHFGPPPVASLQVEQGLGIGSRAPFFNRMEVQSTRFWQLLNPRGKSAPVTLVTHAKVGNALGDLPSYDAYLLGGPFSGAGALRCEGGWVAGGSVVTPGRGL
jgi:hypothetical protein